MAPPRRHTISTDVTLSSNNSEIIVPANTKFTATQSLKIPGLSIPADTAPSPRTERFFSDSHLALKQRLQLITTKDMPMIIYFSEEQLPEFEKHFTTAAADEEKLVQNFDQQYKNKNGGFDYSCMDFSKNTELGSDLIETLKDSGARIHRALNLQVKGGKDITLSEASVKAFISRKKSDDLAKKMAAEKEAKNNANTNVSSSTKPQNSI